MNDIPISIASPYLTEAQLSFDSDEGPLELAEFLSPVMTGDNLPKCD